MDQLCLCRMLYLNSNQQLVWVELTLQVRPLLSSKKSVNRGILYVSILSTGYYTGHKPHVGPPPISCSPNREIRTVWSLSALCSHTKCMWCQCATASAMIFTVIISRLVQCNASEHSQLLSVSGDCLLLVWSVRRGVTRGKYFCMLFDF
jgi:hypothetical protein